MSATDHITEEEVEVLDGEVVPELEENPYAVVPVLPRTGEALMLPELEDRQLAQLLNQVRLWEREELRGFKRDVTDEILTRMDRNAEWTLHLDGYDLSGDSPDRIDYDVDELRKALANLKAEGLITQEAAEAAIRVKTEYEPAKRGIAKLLKLGGKVRDAVEACQRPVMGARSVTIKAKSNGGGDE